MTVVSRRDVLAAVGTTGAAALAGCGSTAADDQPQADVIHSNGDDGTRCLAGVEVTDYREVFGVADVALDVTLVSGHGYGKIVAEWQESDGDKGKAMQTVTPSQDTYELELEAVDNYVHLTVGCDSSDEIEVIVEIAEEDDDE